MNAAQKRCSQNKEIIKEVNTFFEFLEQTLYINVKNSEFAGQNHDPKGYTRFFNLSNSGYKVKKRFFRVAYNIQHILNRFEDGYYLREDEKKEVAVYFDCDNIPDLMVQDVLSIKFHDDKQLYTFRHKCYDEEDSRSYMGINFNP